MSTLRVCALQETVPLSLVLMSASADADEFKVLHEAKLLLQGAVSKDEVSCRLVQAVRSQSSACMIYSIFLLYNVIVTL